MSADYLLPIDCISVEAVADLIDIARSSLAVIDKRHYYGDVKADTKSELIDVDRELMWLAHRLRKAADLSRKRELAKYGDQLPPWQKRWT